MKEHPILFSSPMVKAILEGRKTMTRRVMKPQPFKPDGFFHNGFGDRWIWKGHTSEDYSSQPFNPFILACPYGQVGDRLWVRETWQ